MMDCLRSTTRTLGLIAVLIGALSLAGIGAARARPLAPPPSVHRHGMPCNAMCRAYMAWSARVSAMLHPARRVTTAAVHHRRPPPQRLARHAPSSRQRSLNSFAQWHVPNDPARPAAEPRRAAELPPLAETPRAPETAQAPESLQAAPLTRAAETPQAAPPPQASETPPAAETPAADAASSRPVDQIAERFPALHEFMAARLAGTDAPASDAAEQAFVALAKNPAPQRTDAVDSPRPAPDRRWAAALALALCTLPALYVWWRARGRQARDRARLAMFDAALKAMTLEPSGSSPQ